jgi:hypothetical protein
VHTKRDEVLDMLKAVLYKVESRLQLFAEARVSNLASWNQKHHTRRLPRLLVIVDEIQNAMLDNKSRGEMESTLVDIASRARASGIHVIIATQRPSVDVITGLIKANFPSRVAFNCFSIHDSRTILDTTEAANLGRPGLLVFRGLGNHHFRCQSPWLTEGLIDEIVTNAIAGTGATTTRRSVGIPDLIGWAINENGGKFSVDDIYQQFRPQGITYQEIRNIAVQFGVHSQLIEHGEKFYKYRKRDATFVEVDAAGNPVGVVTIEALLRWALQHNGEFGVNQIYEAFRADLTKKQVIDLCKLYEKKQVELDGVTYRLQPGNNHRVRVWVTVD